ncbi:hypothetical protein K0T92_03165 [Paenibacillus oenotherae]|uniref:Uncharacterized protein n=1 Tax=Paenibacillus oenotherae TaxID=1435645 RepID=A0ABS7D1K6_9BACL|nr:hypothetical protein [Paenibacillus oenotherae]MBW7473743.1 hypothetical protein [Paenibacillus oenotherae]
MRRKSFKMALVGGAIAIVVLFGIDMATSGIERINGPINGQGVLSVNPSSLEDGRMAGSGEAGSLSSMQGNGSGSMLTEGRDDNERERLIREAQQVIDRLKAEEASGKGQAANERLPGMPELGEQSTVNKLADSTAGILQSLSSQGIRFVVSFFDSVTD